MLHTHFISALPLPVVLHPLAGAIGCHVSLNIDLVTCIFWLYKIKKKKKKKNLTLDYSVCCLLGED